MPVCARCGEPLHPDRSNFCGSCGAAAPLPEVAPESLARYREVLKRFSRDGIGEPEAQQLRALREHLAIPQRVHDALMDELGEGPRAAGSLLLQLDGSTLKYFVAESRCMLRFQLSNTGELAFDVQMTAQLNGEPLAAVSSGTIFPHHEGQLQLWFEPQRAGYHELGGELKVEDLLGERTSYHFRGLQFRVATASEKAAVHVVNIDQSSARVVDNSRSMFGSGESGGVGLVGEAEWHDVKLTLEVPEAATSSKPVTTAEESEEDDTPLVVDFSLQTELATYDHGALLAYGDLSTVFAGVERGSGRQIATKIPDDAVDNALMANEVRILNVLRREEGAQLKHLPVIVEQFKTNDGRAATLFERIDGLTLTELRERLPGGVPQEHLIWLARRCLSVLGWAHSNGIVHGNLEPANLLVRAADHNVWLVDWSFAILNPAATGQGFRCLNADYSPPEVAERKPPLPASDLYSLGKCMVFAAGGELSTNAFPDSVDERLQRFFRFFLRESALQRAQDAWDMYKQLDNLREEIFGPHQFHELVI